MKEIRTLVGLSLRQFNALFAAVEAINDLFDPGKKSMGRREIGQSLYVYQAMTIGGGDCYIVVEHDDLPKQIITIKKVQLLKDGTFLVRLVIQARWYEGPWFFSLREAEASQSEKQGKHFFRPMINSFIERALGTGREVIEPIFVVPNDELPIH